MASAHCAIAGARHLQSGESRVYALYAVHRGITLALTFLAAIAAQIFSENGERVAILDIDYHHGNGTQDHLLRRARRVVWLSSH